jgi:hypothetical protein
VGLLLPVRLQMGSKARLMDWHRRLYRAGYIALAWPKEWGGAGAGLVEQIVYDIHPKLDSHRFEPGRPLHNSPLTTLKTLIGCSSG